MIATRILDPMPSLDHYSGLKQIPSRVLFENPFQSHGFVVMFLQAFPAPGPNFGFFTKEPPFASVPSICIPPPRSGSRRSNVHGYGLRHRACLPCGA
jgi:hypothetical protein